MEGYLSKKGKRIGSRVKRYMRFHDHMLSNHHHPSSAPTWQVNLIDASVSCDPKRKRILIDLYNNKLELYADSYDECEQWYQALTKPATPKKSRTQSSESNHSQLPDAKLTAVAGDVPPAQTETPDDSRKRTPLGTNFKVVKPQRRQSSLASSKNSDDTYVAPNLPVVQAQVYEETPASMIFKQFTFAGPK